MNLCYLLKETLLRTLRAAGFSFFPIAIHQIMCNNKLKFAVLFSFLLRGLFL